MKQFTNKEFCNLPRLIREGDSPELTVMLSQLRLRAMGWLIKHLYMPPEDAEDYTHFALLKLSEYSKAGKMDERSIMGFVLTVARHKHLSHYRRTKIVSEISTETFETTDHIPTLSSSSNAIESLQYKQVKAILERESKRLPLSHQKIFKLLMERPELSDEEMAKILKLQNVTFRTQKRRMRIKLLKYYTESLKEKMNNRPIR